MKEAFQHLWDLLTRKKRRLAKQCAYIRNVFRCRAEKRWMSARRDIIEVIYGSGSPEHRKAVADCGVVGWGHFMVGPDGDTIDSYPMPIHAAKIEHADHVREILILLNADSEKVLQGMQAQFALPLDTTRF